MPRVDLDGIAEFSHVEAPNGMPKGSRNWDLYRYACSLQSRGVSDEDMVDECLRVASTMDPPLDDWEVLKVVHSAQTKQKGASASGLGRRREAPRTMPDIPYVPLRHGHPEMLPDYSGASQLAMATWWIMSLFDPQDVVCIAWDMAKGYQGGKGGEAHMLAGQLVEPGNPFLPSMLEHATNGLWAVVNPLDGSGGRRGENVAAYRNLLVECDELDSDGQLERICALLMNGDRGGPDAATLTWSGGKSWHAVVRVDARDADDYAMRKNWVYAMCARNGLPVDVKCGNPTRFTRVAGAMRGGVLQRLAMRRRPSNAWSGTPEDWAEEV